MKPVFIHSGWRTGSTYLWEKFRALPDTTAYYEPFNEILISLDEHVLTLHPDSWSSHHPPSSRPYFAEYRPVLDGRTVRNFSQAFSYRTFFLSPDDRNDAMAAYIATLIEAAVAGGRTPVFGFCRSLGRVGWLAARFDSYNILLLRDPRQQWASIWQQKTDYGNNYFYIMYFLIMGQNRDHPLLAPLAERWAVPRIVTESVSDDYEQYLRLYQDSGFLAGYSVFFYQYLITLINAVSHADIIVDIDRLSTDICYRRTIEEELGRSGFPLRFDDARMARHRISDIAVDLSKVEDDVLAMLDEHPLRPGMAELILGRTGPVERGSVTAMHLYRAALTRQGSAWRSRVAGR